MSDDDTVTLVFSTAKHGSAKIRWMTRSEFSHVDMLVSDGLLGASDSPNSPYIRGNPRGVAVRPFHYQEAYGGWGRRHLAVIRTPLAPYIIAKAEGQLGKPFDQRALYALYLPWLRKGGAWLDPDQWYCMELVLWAFDGMHGPEKKRFFSYELAIHRTMVVPEDGILIFNPYFDVELFKAGWSGIPPLVKGSSPR